MNELIICIGAEAPEKVCWAERDATGSLSVVCGSLREASGRIVKRTVVLVPGSEVLLTRATLPTGSKKLALKAIPYAIEDNLASDVEGQHFAFGRKNSDQTLAVAVVDNLRMEAWLSMLREVGIEPDIICPATLAVPINDQGIAVLIEGGDALVRLDSQQGYGIDQDNLPMILNADSDKAAEGAALKVRIYNCSGEQLPAFGPAIELDEVAAGKGRLAMLSSAGQAAWHLASGFDEKKAINLLQGTYSRNAEWGKAWQKWQLPIMLLAVLMVLHISSQISDFYRLRAESLNLDSAIVNVYKTTFPKAKKVVKPRVQMEQKLKLLQGGGDAGGSGFLELFDKTGQILIQGKGVKLLNLRFQEEVIELEFETTDLQALDELKGALVKQPGVEVEIKNASAVNDHVLARMRIKAVAQ
ncbi:MAG: type II secretion system protein GspL [Proteobacteria bacterium]|nr:type II secretion system protein GspL [Pseudomonadota bacterium]MBU1716968.1 type II secretion system protein GspL [Pseudomonadota bacterium]